MALTLRFDAAASLLLQPTRDAAVALEDPATKDLLEPIAVCRHPCKPEGHRSISVEDIRSSKVHMVFAVHDFEEGRRWAGGQKVLQLHNYLTAPEWTHLAAAYVDQRHKLRIIAERCRRLGRRGTC